MRDEGRARCTLGGLRIVLVQGLPIIVTCGFRD